MARHRAAARAQGRPEAPARRTSRAIPRRIQRFEQEARAASALNHPNVCTIHALDQTSEGQHYIAMEYVEGETLRRRLATSRLSVREALDIAIQVAAALSVAHAAGIVHRDIKPENVMLRPDGVVKVLDFGLAKLAPAVVPDRCRHHADGRQHRRGHGGGHRRLHVARAGAWPAGGRADGHLVARRDALRDGRRAQPVRRAERQRRARRDPDQNEPAPVARFEPDAPAELQRILTKTLRKDRSQRYQTVQDLLLDLQALRDDSANRTPRLTRSAAVDPRHSGCRPA